MGVNVETDEISAGSMAIKGDARPPETLANGHRAPAPIGSVEAERNTIFDSLVRAEGEVSGLVAYSIYKQNKRAWLNDFQKTVGRPPTEAETRAYIIGESTERRLATYRHLAQSTLAGQGPEGGSRTSRASRSGWFYLGWLVALVAAVAIVAYALRTGVAIPK